MTVGPEPAGATNLSISTPASQSEPTAQPSQGFEIQYPQHIQSAKARKLHKDKVLRSLPETLVSDYSGPEENRVSSPKVYSSIRTLRDSLAVLEQEFTQFREDTLANYSSHTQQANSVNCPGTAKHVLIHTGTNDLSTRRIDVAKALKQVAAKATQEYPAAKVTISTLLPRTDVPQRIIHSINAEVSRGCALLPNVHLAHHRDFRHYHLYDQVHLNKEGVKMFTRVLKDTALGRTSTSNYSDKRNPAIHAAPPTPPTQPPAPTRPCIATLAAC
ncbi:hypothetical protein SKAU_G00275020 [Synaphobranchus kaupii]|uniref:Uncharacterized protein n=1 Tax=Synaphobranchus kaupii TaxID=118154 RepID=A0A9Q1INY7_SYNKA|nr:hypothetical protein SKAU_G00275020 [Synaphobranchus kaupii]